MREKLLDLMKNEGLKPSQLAEQLEINPAGISHILAGRNKPGFDLLQKILRRFPRINPDWLLLDSDKMYRDEYPAASSGQQPPVQRRHKGRPPNWATTFSRRHCRADFGRMKNKRRTPTGMTDLRRSFRRRCSAKRISNASSCSMMTRPSKVLRHRQSVEIIHAGRCPEYSILGKIKFGQPGFRFETDGTWSIPETLGNYLLIGKEKFLATVQLPVFITRFI